MQVDQLVEKNTLLNQENLALKQRLNELENRSKIDVSSIEDNIKTKVLKHIQQVDQDQDTIENQSITIQNLEVLTSDLKDQLSGVDNLYTYEKNATKNFQNRLDGLVAANKENLENLKTENSKHSKQIEDFLEQRISFERQLQNATSKVQNLEAQNTFLKSELEASSIEKDRLTTKLREYEDIISMLKKSLDDFIAKKDSEISRIRELLGLAEKEIFTKTSEYEILKAENYQLNQTVSNMALLNTENRIEKLESELKKSQDSLRKTQEILRESDKKIDTVIKNHQEEKSKLMINNNEKIEEKSKELENIKQKLEEALKIHNQTEFENNDLRFKLFDYEEVILHNSSLKEKLNIATDENKKVAEEMTQLKKNFFVSGKELLEKNRLTVDQSKMIKEQEQQIKTLEESLTTAFEDIKRLHLNFEEAKKTDDTMDLPPVRKNDEVDVKLREIMIKTKVPIKFIRIGEGLYVFGSKRVHVKILNSKLVIRIGGGYMYVEEFIRMYAHQELAKLKNREEAQLSDTEQEESLLELRNNQILQQEESIEQLTDQFPEYRIIVNPNSVLERSPNKRHVEKNTSSSFLDNRRSSAEQRSFLTQDFSTQSFNDGIVYEIGPKGGLTHSLPKVPINTIEKDRTPDRKRSIQNDPPLSLRIPEPEKRALHKYQDLASARDNLSSSRGYSRRSIGL